MGTAIGEEATAQSLTPSFLLPSQPEPLQHAAPAPSGQAGQTRALENPLRERGDGVRGMWDTPGWGQPVHGGTEVRYGASGRDGLSGRLRADAGMVFFYKCSFDVNDIDHVISMQIPPPPSSFVVGKICVA